MDNLNNGRPSTPDPQCSICLNGLTNKCYSNGCVHLFCFNCLQRWSNTCLQESSSSEPTCPLCKESFKYIHHSFDDLGVFETYTVLILGRLPIPRLRVRPFSELSNGNRMFSGIPSLLNIDHVNQTTMNTSWSVFGLNEVVHNHNQLYHHLSQNYPRPTLQIPIIGIYYNFINRMPLPCVDSILQLLMYNIEICTFLIIHFYLLFLKL